MDAFALEVYAMLPRIVSHAPVPCAWALAATCLACSCAAPAASSGSRGPGSNAVAGTSGTTPNATDNGSGSTLLPTPATGPGTDMICASAVVHTTKNMPTIVFVIDGSGSMCAPFGMSTRWEALRSALLEPTKGLIYRLQNTVSFGATLYDGTIDSKLALDLGLLQDPLCALLLGALGGRTTGACPQLLEAMPAKLNNAQAIDMVFPSAQLGGSTPTDKAMSHVMDALIATRHQQSPDDQAQSRVYVILATDGAPNDICMNGTGGDGSVQRQGVIAAVDRGSAAGITTWVISLADGDVNLQMHLDEVAKHGDPMNANARTFSPTSPDELIMTLAQLLGGAVGCHIALNGAVTVGQECTGTVEQNGVALPCCQTSSVGALTCGNMPTASANGWRLSDPHSIELLGDACTNFLLGPGALLSARFPCAVFRPD